MYDWTDRTSTPATDFHAGGAKFDISAEFFQKIIFWQEWCWNAFFLKTGFKIGVCIIHWCALYTGKYGKNWLVRLSRPDKWKAMLDNLHCTITYHFWVALGKLKTPAGRGTWCVSTLFLWYGRRDFGCGWCWRSTAVLLWWQWFWRATGQPRPLALLASRHAASQPSLASWPPCAGMFIDKVFYVARSVIWTGPVDLFVLLVLVALLFLLHFFNLFKVGFQFSFFSCFLLPTRWLWKQSFWGCLSIGITVSL